MKTLTKILTLSMALFGTSGCSNLQQFSEAKALDYSARGAVYCGKETTFKYLDMKRIVIIVCDDGRLTTIQKDDGIFGGLF